MEENGDRTRERLKYVPRIANLAEAADELKLSRPERNLMKTYDGKPVMTRPQHRFYQGEICGKKYFEIDIDSHTYNFVARKVGTLWAPCGHPALRVSLCVLSCRCLEGVHLKEA